MRWSLGATQPMQLGAETARINTRSGAYGFKVSPAIEQKLLSVAFGPDTIPSPVFERLRQHGCPQPLFTNWPFHFISPAYQCITSAQGLHLDDPPPGARLGCLPDGSLSATSSKKHLDSQIREQQRPWQGRC